MNLNNDLISQNMNIYTFLPSIKQGYLNQYDKTQYVIMPRNFEMQFLFILMNEIIFSVKQIAQSLGAVEYTDSTSVEG